MAFLPHTNTVILLEWYCGTITEPGLPVVEHSVRRPQSSGTTYLAKCPALALCQILNAM